MAYGIGGGRCTGKQHKMAVSGYMWGNGGFFEFSKECYDVKHCLEVSIDWPNPPGVHRYTIAIVFGWKSRWFTMPHYKWARRSYRF
jgi:hypothetical protein